MGLARVRVTANFEATLATIEAYWRSRGAPEALGRLVEELDRAVAALERHPRLGRNFLARATRSLEARDRDAALRGTLGGQEVRAVVAGDYLMLYALDPSTRPPSVALLAIWHHRELSFDFEGYWQENRPPVRRQE
ncbi:MAG: type II toxin-antitoxin system RelE/ParE family toxin [Burkholderiales bacterium]|nr:type II toxin-antitoxin system RelE/ParE family toxin [Burkholderiales bacterium]